MALHNGLVVGFDDRGPYLKVPGVHTPIIAGGPLPTGHDLEAINRYGLDLHGDSVSEVPVRIVATVADAQLRGEPDVPLDVLHVRAFPHYKSIRGELSRHILSPARPGHLLQRRSWSNPVSLPWGMPIETDDRRALAAYVHVGTAERRPEPLPVELVGLDDILARGAQLEVQGWPQRAWDTYAAALMDKILSEAEVARFQLALTGAELQLGRPDLVAPRIKGLRGYASRLADRLLNIDAARLEAVLLLQSGLLKKCTRAAEQVKDRLAALRDQISREEYYRRIDGLCGTLAEAYRRRARKAEGRNARFVSPSNPHSRAAAQHLRVGEDAAEALGSESRVANSAVRWARWAMSHRSLDAYKSSYNSIIDAAEKARSKLDKFPALVFDRSKWQYDLFQSETMDHALGCAKRARPLFRELSSRGYASQFGYAVSALRLYFRTRRA